MREPMTSPEQSEATRCNAALSAGLHCAVAAESAPLNSRHWPANTGFSSAFNEDFDRIRRPLKEKSQTNSGRIGFVSQKHINEAFPPPLFTGEMALRSPRGEAGTEGAMS